MEAAVKTLLNDLDRAKSEEDVKDAYIKSLGLTQYRKSLIDISTKEIWFEAKFERTDLIKMFAQLLFYVKEATKKPDPDNPIPFILCVIDKEHAAIMETESAKSLLSSKSINWPKKGSAPEKDYIEQVRSFVGTHYVEYEISTRGEEFIQCLRDAIKTKKINRTPITPDNLRIVFDKWVEDVGVEISDVSKEDLCLLFFADVMSDGRSTVQQDLPAQLVLMGDEPAFHLKGKVCCLKSTIGYKRFWQIFHRPPMAEYRHYMLERRDSLLPLDARQFKGAYYTPLNVVEKAYEYLQATLGKRWQDRYVMWDPCCGVGNLQVKHSNYRNIFMSTLDQADVDVMKSTRTCLGAEIFQYDFLNDDINEDGSINHDGSTKLPKSLKVALKDKSSKFLVLMNPPYAEATNYNNIAEKAQKVKAKNKSGVADTRVSNLLMDKTLFGKATQELFTQFLARLCKEFPEFVVGTFSTLKFIQAPNFGDFRANCWNAEFLSGFVVPSTLFELKGKFPVAFTIWKVGSKKFNPNKRIVLDVFDAKLNIIGQKTILPPSGNDYLNTWFKRARANDEDCVPLCNGLNVTSGKAHLHKWADGAVAYMHCNANDFSHAEQMTAIYSSAFGAGHGIYITKENFEQSFLTYCARRIEKPSWINDRDQFFQPYPEAVLTREFKNDSLIWMIFNRTQRTASADDLLWNGKTWSIVSHLIPFTEQEVNAPSRFESTFLVDYMKGKHFSHEAQQVLEEGRLLWIQYFSEIDEKKTRDKFHLGRPDVSWYQIRKALEQRLDDAKARGVPAKFSFDNFNETYEKLTLKLRPLYYQFGFIRDTNPCLEKQIENKK